MTEKEQYEEGKRLTREKNRKLKLYQVILADKNIQYKMEDNENKQMELLSEINTLTNEITALRRNKYNSKFYEWIPFTGLNRKQRRSR